MRAYQRRSNGDASSRLMSAIMMNDSPSRRIVLAQRCFGDPSNYLQDNAVIPLRRLLVREVLGELQDQRIVDVGCGDGTLSLQYADVASHIALVDFSDTMLETAQANAAVASASNVSFHRSDINAEKFLSIGVADVVLCVGVLAHVPDPEVAVDRVASLVRPGGRLLLQISDYDRPFGKCLYFLWDIASRSRGYRPARTGSRGAIVWARASGLTLTAVTSYPGMLPGYRLLPIGLQRRVFDAAHHWRVMAPFRTETLLLFERQPERPPNE